MLLLHFQTMLWQATLLCHSVIKLSGHSLCTLCCIYMLKYLVSGIYYMIPRVCFQSTSRGRLRERGEGSVRARAGRHVWQPGQSGGRDVNPLPRRRGTSSHPFYGGGECCSIILFLNVLKFNLIFTLRCVQIKYDNYEYLLNSKNNF